LKGLKGVGGCGGVPTTGRVFSPSLPKFKNEPDEIYNLRVQRSYLTNYFLRTIQSDSGKIMASPVAVDGVPKSYDAVLEDVDLEGMPIGVFTASQLQQGQAKGVALAYVDHIKEENRSFVHEIDIDDVLLFKTSGRTGRLSYLRWKGSVITDSDDESIQIDNSNVEFEITPTEWRIYSEDDLDVPMDSGEIIRFRNGTTRIIDEIPVSVYYTNKKGVLLADSPYRALAELTIEHFQVSSDIKNMLFYALHPVLFGKGMPDGMEMSALASYIAIMIGEGAADSSKTDLKWVQVDAGPIEQAREQIADIESRISAFGIDANGIRPSGNQTATAKAIDSAGSNAALSMFANGLQEHIERIINIMSTYTLEELNPSVTITPDFNLSDNSEKSKDAMEAYKIRLISGKAATDVMKQNNSLPESYDYDDDRELVNNDMASDALI